MRVARALPLRRALVAGIVLSAIGVMSTEVACVIAQPTDNVPSLPASRPVIVRTRVQPPTSAPITAWTTNYRLYVELVDPTSDVQYASFIDYNSLTGEGLVDGTLTSHFNTTTIPSDRVRIIDVTIPAPAALDRCHVIEIIVSAPFSAQDPRSAHTPPEPPGGDSVTWFYAPGGDLTGCPSLDAVIDASIIEDAAESGAR